MRLDDDLDAERYRYLVEHHGREIHLMLAGNIRSSRHMLQYEIKKSVDSMIDCRRSLKLEPTERQPVYEVVEQ